MKDKSKMIKVLYAGDSPVGGAANYLLGVLKSIPAKVTHLSPNQKLRHRDLSSKWDVIIFSDYSCRQVSPILQKEVVRQVEEGCGFLMVGGWGSFSGPFGGWKGSVIEKILPVNCLDRDDRMNFPGGAQFSVAQNHPAFSRDLLADLPVIVGLNKVTAKKKMSRTLLSARKIVQSGNRIVLESAEFPLLVISSGTSKKTAAFMTDFAPHWCGGMIDWGKRSVKLPVTGKIKIEVGDSYRRFISSLILWLASPSDYRNSL